MSAEGDVDDEDTDDATTPPKSTKPTSQEDLQLKKAIELLSAPASEKKAA